MPGPSLPAEVRAELARFVEAAIGARDGALDTAQVLHAVHAPFGALLAAVRESPWREEGRCLLVACEAITVFSMGSPPGGRGEIHDHGVWGLVGQVAGSELEIEYVATRSTTEGVVLRPIATRRLGPGDVTIIDPPARDIHRVINAGQDLSVSLHAFGHDLLTEGFNIYPPRSKAPCHYRGKWLGEEVAR